MKLNTHFFSQLLKQASKSERKRAHQNLHVSFNDPTQRLCIALIKGTYVRPHQHVGPNRWELILVLKGAVGLVIFDDDGMIIDKDTLTPGDSISGLELKPNTWHTVYPVSDEAIIIEIKEGPYNPETAANFATWAPMETDSSAKDLLYWVERAKVGDRYLKKGGSKPESSFPQ
ncbi:cupin fold metalloprotein, WbuC family [Vibrio coralliilyticus]|uniref:WbuC family cupin fold metalloprotein n=1 Tax=Vibrio TaxID=662 RepID=UPI00068AE1E6|nr:MULTISPECIES: WbuC family cupin fold metalloprotein [Vibrio]NOI18058.1 cupin fold metalloprotein, WbuC family [Vibrio coralliilyticus]